MSKLPYIICHMMTSIDGRIDCAMEHPLTHLHLTSVEKCSGDAVWLRYAL